MPFRSDPSLAGLRIIKPRTSPLNPHAPTGAPDRDPFALRRAEPDYPTDPAVWLASNRMTQTEVGLRLAHYLIAQKLVTTDIVVVSPATSSRGRSARAFRSSAFCASAATCRNKIVTTGAAPIY